jgi:2-amino-4-hydroxy-6-hydroxymethyldihydropteridine diphosphokinase
MRPTPDIVYLGLGANLGDRGRTIAAAVRALAERRILYALCVSPIYETKAVAPDPQPMYLNAVVRGETHMSAAEVLSSCLEIERALGRVRPSGRPKAARVIDIDLLLYGAEVIDTHALKVPHPALLERAFVLIPLADVALPGLTHPKTGVALTVAASSSGVRRVVPPPLVGHQATTLLATKVKEE